MELKTKNIYIAEIIYDNRKYGRQFTSFEDAEKYIAKEIQRYPNPSKVKSEIKLWVTKVLEYWVVESGTCFDTCVSKEYHNFETEQEAWKWYKENAIDLSTREYGYCCNPEKREIIFE